MIRLARIFAALTLVIAVFAVIPATDAAACTPEIPALEQVLNPHPSDTHGGEGVESGACAHGHCHHCGITAPPAIDDMRSMALDRAPLAPSLDQAPASRMPAGPMRPPRT